jgi:RND family efflux transporter MFP subunit
MKAILPLSLLVFVLGCAGGATTEEAPPETLPEMRKALREKQAELRALSQEIEQLEIAIAINDPSVARAALVTTEPVEATDFAHFVSIQGSVMAEDLVAAVAEISGRILRLTVQEGDVVRQGQLIATIDVEGIEKQIEELETSLSLARTVFDRQGRLWAQKIGSELQYLEAKNNVERLEKSLEGLRVQLDKRHVYAPIGGSVETIVTQSGEVAAPGAPIVQILNTNKLQIEADVPETYLQVVDRGETVRVRIPALDTEFTAPIRLVGRTIDPSNRTFRIEIPVRNVSAKLKPNLLAEVLIQDYEEKDVIVVPLDRVQQEVGGKRYVMIAVAGDNDEVIARKAYVSTGATYDNRAVITEGLTAGDDLIIEGARGLVDNDPIEIVNDKTATTDAAIQ